MDDHAFVGFRAPVANRRSFAAMMILVSFSLAINPLLGMATSVFAEAPSSAPAATVPAATAPVGNAELAAKRAKIAEQIEKLSAAENKKPDAKQLAGVAETEDELDLLRSLELLYVQHQSTIDQQAELQEEKKIAQTQMDSLTKFGPDEPKPYSFWLLEDLRDAVAAEDDRHDAYTLDLTSAQGMLEAARNGYEEAERARHKAKEELQAAPPNTEANLECSHKLQLAELASTSAQELVALRRLEIELKTLRQETCKLRWSYFSEKINRIEKEVRFTERDYQSRLTEFSKSRDELKRKLRDAEQRLHQVEIQRTAATTEVAKGATNKVDLALVNEAFQLARRVNHEEITLIQQRLGELEHYKHFLTCRFELASHIAKKDDIREWAQQLEGLRNQLKQTESALSLRLEELRVDQATLYHRGRQLEEQNTPAMHWIDYQTDQMQRLATTCEAGLIDLKSNRRMLKRFAGDLEAASDQNKTSRWIDKTRDALSTFWHYEISSVDDHPITVAKIISALFYFVVGLVAARVISAIFGGRLLKRFGLNEGARHAVQSITFYSLCILFTTLTLEIVNLPFAAFTFLGGAVVIALGFGTQNILNNFISGLILLAEQPIRVGDLVEIDGHCGTVEKIGARSTCVRTVSNHEIIVPNSSLLENKVTNLTLSDDLIQTAIGVTLSPTLHADEVREILFEAAVSHPMVLRSPEPVVLFKEFSTTSMSFELHFWIQLKTIMARSVAESEVRAKINRSLGNTDAATTTVNPSKAA